MRKLEKRAFLCVLIILAFLLGLGYFLALYMKEGRSWFIQKYNRHLYNSDGYLESGTITDRNGVILSHIEDGVRKSHTDALLRTATLHVVGDTSGKIGSSVLANCAKYFVSYNTADGASAMTPQGNTCILTIDSKANQVAYEAMNGLNGTVCVYNYKTGEILCLVSTPSYDPEHVPEDLETNSAYSGAYLNRFLQSVFTPGSTMKSITLAAALENLPDCEERTYTCKGSVPIGNGLMRCTKAHGSLTLKEAFAQSCNCVFAELAVELGGETLQKYVKQAGLTTSYHVDGMTSTAKGSFELVTVEPHQLSYAGIGLFHDQVNPCAMLLYYGAIANGGNAAMPTILSSVVDGEKQLLYATERSYTEKLIRPETATKLQEYLEYNVERIYDKSRFPKVAIGAKSGTVEQKVGLSNCWFAGFTKDDRYPYAFVVYIEGAGSGNRVAGGVAATVLKELIPE